MGGEEEGLKGGLDPIGGGTWEIGTAEMAAVQTDRRMY